MCDLCMAFSLFSSFMSPMRMNNPRSQNYVSNAALFSFSFSSHLFFLLIFFHFLSAFLGIQAVFPVFFCLPLKVPHLFLPWEFISYIQETILLALQNHINQESIFHFLSVMDSDFSVTGFGKAHKEEENHTTAISQQYQSNYTGKYN